jgi:hypothetical protein
METTSIKFELLETGREVEILSESEFRRKIMNLPSFVGRFMPHDYNNWTSFILKDNSQYDSFSTEEKMEILSRFQDFYPNLYKK